MEKSKESKNPQRCGEAVRSAFRTVPNKETEDFAEISHPLSVKVKLEVMVSSLA